MKNRPCADTKSRPNIWKTICGIDDGLLPFICGATISTGLSTMLESSFEWERFISGCFMFLTSAFVFWWYINLSKTKREIAENNAADKALLLNDKEIWEQYHNKRRTRMKVLVILSLIFLVFWGIFLYLSYINNIPTGVLSTLPNAVTDPVSLPQSP